jgi:hypothetical protein
VRDADADVQRTTWTDHFSAGNQVDHRRRNADRSDRSPPTDVRRRRPIAADRRPSPPTDLRSSKPCPSPTPNRTPARDVSARRIARAEERVPATSFAVPSTAHGANPFRARRVARDEAAMSSDDARAVRRHRAWSEPYVRDADADVQRTTWTDHFSAGNQIGHRRRNADHRFRSQRRPLSDRATVSVSDTEPNTDHASQFDEERFRRASRCAGTAPDAQTTSSNVLAT